MDQALKKQKFINDFNPNDTVYDIFVLTGSQQYQAKNGPYWRLFFKDLSGEIEAKIWSPASQEYEGFENGAFYLVSGRVGTYKDKKEFAPDFVRKLEPEESLNIDLADFMQASAFDPEEMYLELKKICHEVFVHPPLKKFIKLLLNDEEISTAFKIAPAAKAMHHTYASGLLEHTLSVARLCMKIAEHYPQLDRQMLLAGAVCHDLGKIWELSSGLNVDYTDSGRLLGHINISLEKIQPYLKKSGLEDEFIMHLQHLIISHHGQLEFGSPKLPATAEALILHYADNIDAKLQQLSNALSDLESDELGWSAYVYGMDRFLYKSRQVPSPENEKNGKEKNDKEKDLPETQLSFFT